MLTIKVKRLIITIAAVIAVIAIVFTSHAIRSWFSNVSMRADTHVITSDSALLEESVRRVAQLATLSLRYTEAGVEEDQRTIELFGQVTAIPGTMRRMIVRWQGDILFGINAEEISINIVQQVSTREVQVTLPEAIILSHAIDLSSVQVLDETTGIFARHGLGDLSSFLDARHQYINTRAETVAMLQTAQANARDSIYHFLRLVLDDGMYTITFV